MSNYTRYPKWRLVKNSCIICFSESSFSWCMLPNNQRLYLLKSGYMNGAARIDMMDESGEVKSYSLPDFLAWLKENSTPKEISKNE